MTRPRPRYRANRPPSNRDSELDRNTPCWLDLDHTLYTLAGHRPRPDWHLGEANFLDMEAASWGNKHAALLRPLVPVAIMRTPICFSHGWEPSPWCSLCSFALPFNVQRQPFSLYNSHFSRIGDPSAKTNSPLHLLQGEKGFFLPQVIGYSQCALRFSSASPPSGLQPLSPFCPPPALRPTTVSWTPQPSAKYRTAMVRYATPARPGFQRLTPVPRI